MSSENTNVIDEKKAEESNTNIGDFKGFATNYLSSIVFTIGIAIFIVGGLGLYTTKVAQANILPDNVELAPFTLLDRVVSSDFPVDINIMRTSLFAENNDTLSQKAIFRSQEYLDSFNGGFLCSLKNSANPENGVFSNASLYFSFVYENIIAKNFLAINTVFFYLSHLPESLIMILYGFFGIFLWMALYFFNVCISIFYHILNIPQLFRSTSEQSEKQWESTDNISFLRITKLLMFFFVWIPVGMFSTFIMPAFFTLYGLISPLFAKYNIKNGESKAPYSVFDFIKDTFAFKKSFFFILATLSLFSNGTKYLGNNAIIGIVVAVIFAYFMGLYSNEMPEQGVDGFTAKIKQTMKQAPVEDVIKNNPKLVEVCTRIPIDDKKFETLIAKGRRRGLTGKADVGGSTTPSEGESIHVSNSSSTSTSTSLKEKLDALKQQLKQSEENVSGGADYADHYALEARLKPEISSLEEEMQKTTQSGGSRNKRKLTKYNIKWT
jgi:hypothetical protein